MALLLNNCATLTKTQIETVNKFAKTTTDFSDYPSKIMVELADIRMERGLYYANTIGDAKLHIQELDDIHDQKNFDIKISKKVDITFKIIDKYAQSLVLLSSASYAEDLDKQAKQFGVELDSLIAINNRIEDTPKVPIGVGAAVNELIALGGKQYIKRKQAKEIKIFVERADTLVGTMTTNLLQFLESDNIAELIDGEIRGVRSNYLSYIRSNNTTSVEDDKKYLALKTRLDEVKKLQQNSIKATKKLRESHGKLLEEIQEKKKLKENITELQELFEEVKDLKDTIDKIESTKE